VLTQIIMERHPEKISLFPTDMLHFILRSNDVMSQLLADYFRQSLTYLDHLQRQSRAATLVDPRPWIKAWLDSISSAPGDTGSPQVVDGEANAAPDQETTPVLESAQLTQRVKQLEERIEQLESGEA
jgi:hypothetical protein